MSPNHPPVEQYDEAPTEQFPVYVAPDEMLDQANGSTDGSVGSQEEFAAGGSGYFEDTTTSPRGIPMVESGYPTAAPQESMDPVAQQTQEAAKRTIRQRLGALLFRGRRSQVELSIPGADDEQGTDFVETSADTEAPTEQLPTVEQASEQDERAPLSSYVAELLTDESILAEKTSLQRQFETAIAPDDMPDGMYSVDAVKAYYGLKDRAEFTKVGEHARLAITQEDARFKELYDTLLESPKMKPGTWFEQPEEVDREIFTKASDKPIEIPVSNLVSAVSLESWAGRGINGSGEKEREHDHRKGTSAEAIDMYANMATTPPPVGVVKAFVQPNGLVFYQASFGSHRAAAAVKRGDEYLQTNELVVANLKHNYFDLPETENVEDEHKLAA